MTGELPQRFSAPVAISREKQAIISNLAPALKVR